MKKLIFLLVLGVVLSGCAMVGPISVPGDTSASYTLRADIMHMIHIMQNAYAKSCSYKVIDTKAIGKEGNSILEEWTVLSCNKEVVYPVKLTPSPQGGTYFSVSTPEAYIKK
ncbi:MAG: hypothetical protein Q8O13_02755 [Candidatus Omnitrophota bacterium]|nr:hypothetical protein [Candidatus Omnitrophota bacterium]